MTKRLLSGIQPSGELHIGNYLGAIKQWVEYQNDYDAFFAVVDYHALTTKPEPKVLHQRTLDILAMLLACGIDPKSSPLFLQSQVAAHAELNWMLASFVGLGQLDRMTQFKEKSSRHGQNAGLYTYPILQAADVLLYAPDVVPVGEDQAQHLELTRDVAQSFNSHVGQKLLVEPKTLLNNGARIMALNDPTKKMSKSIPGSAIGLLATEAEVTQTIKRAVTDSDPNASQLGPGVKNLLLILEGVSDRAAAAHFENLHAAGKLRYSELKEAVTEEVLRFLGPIQKAYQSLRADEKTLLNVATEGRAKAEAVANTTLKKVKEALGLVVG